MFGLGACERSLTFIIMLKLRDYYIKQFGIVRGIYMWNLVFDYWFTEDNQVINLLKF